MERTIKILFLFLILCFNDLNAQGYLKAEGKKIVDEQGKEVILRGIGLGGWMLQEGYMLGTSGPQHKLEARFAELVGMEKKNAFYEAWLKNHMRKIDVDSMASWGFNSIRLPMHYKLFTPPIEEEPVPGQITWVDKGFEMVDELLSWVKENNMYLILDLHAAPGGQGKNADINDYDSTKPSLWESQANQEKTIALWRKLAERYVDEPNLGAYNLINEPNWGFENLASDPNGCSESKNNILWELQRKITEAIREVDQKHMVIIEGNCWGNNYNGLPTLWDNNLVISYHKYWNSNEQSSIQGMLNMRNQRNVPIWLGESGENSNTWFTDAIELLENNGIGWSWWPLKKLGLNNPLQIKRNEGYQEILDYWAGKVPKPSVDKAYAALMQYAEDLKLENNIYHKDVVDAMIRQPHSEEALSFKENIISATSENRIFAVDYDLGRHGIAYHDKDVTNTTGQAGGLVWNHGRSYRNDGVDIQACNDEITNGYHVGWIEDGEWLQYTLNVEDEGYYSIKIRYASANSAGRVSLGSNGVKLAKTINLASTGSYLTWQTVEVRDILLKSGVNRLRINADRGGYNLNFLEFNKQEALESEQPEIIEGTIRHKENLIQLVFNQEMYISDEYHGISVTVNGTATSINSVVLHEDLNRIVVIELLEPVVYGNLVLVSWPESVLFTAAGVAVNKFDELPIKILSDMKIHELPGRIKVEEYTVNSGFQFEDCSDTGGGKNAGYTDTGDFLDFTVLVKETGNYRASFRVASQNASGRLTLQLVEEDRSVKPLGTVEFNPTGGWQTWATVTGSPIYLEQGLVTLRLLAGAPLFNINWFQLVDPTTVTGTTEQIKEPSLNIFPNPSNGKFTVDMSHLNGRSKKITVLNTMGKVMWHQAMNHETQILEVDNYLPLGVYILLIEHDGGVLGKRILIK